MTAASRPWWASPDGPEGGPGTDGSGADDPDPVEAFRASRRPRERGAGAHAPGGAGSAEETAGERPAGERRAEDPGAVHRPELCGVCPLCTLARSLEDTRPELLEHLTEAVRHLAAAARTFLEPPTGAPDGGTQGVQHIDLDDHGAPEPGGAG